MSCKRLPRNTNSLEALSPALSVLFLSLMCSPVAFPNTGTHTHSLVVDGTNQERAPGLVRLLKQLQVQRGQPVRLQRMHEPKGANRRIGHGDARPPEKIPKMVLVAAPPPTAQARATRIEGVFVEQLPAMLAMAVVVRCVQLPDLKFDLSAVE